MCFKVPKYELMLLRKVPTAGKAPSANCQKTKKDPDNPEAFLNPSLIPEAANTKAVLLNVVVPVGIAIVAIQVADPGVG